LLDLLGFGFGEIWHAGACAEVCAALWAGGVAGDFVDLVGGAAGAFADLTVGFAEDLTGGVAKGLLELAGDPAVDFKDFAGGVAAVFTSFADVAGFFFSDCLFSRSTGSTCPSLQVLTYLSLLTALFPI
jgi:hypothetical protein